GTIPDRLPESPARGLSGFFRPGGQRLASPRKASRSPAEALQRPIPPGGAMGVKPPIWGGLRGSLYEEQATASDHTKQSHYQTSPATNVQGTRQTGRTQARPPTGNNDPQATTRRALRLREAHPQASPPRRGKAAPIVDLRAPKELPGFLQKTVSHPRYAHSARLPPSRARGGVCLWAMETPVHAYREGCPLLPPPHPAPPPSPPSDGHHRPVEADDLPDGRNRSFPQAAQAEPQDGGLA